MDQKIANLEGKLIVSCQALPEEPLHSSFIMGRMALAAKIGGACGIRANTKEDIREIQSQVDLPVIGIVKRDYADREVYITPPMKEIEELMEVKPEIIAMDATEAAIFTNKLNPKTVVPIHYGLVVGTKEDLNTFKENLKEDIKIEEKLFIL